MNSAATSYAAYLFDFDGTLADSYAAIAASVNHVRAGYGLPALAVAEVKRYVGRGPDYLLNQTVPGGELERDVATYRAHHPSIMVPLTRLLPGAGAVLERLHHQGKRIGLCSNKPRLFSRELLRHLRVLDLFEVVLGPEDVVHPKPAPDMLLCAVGKLGLPAGDILYIGDMTVDIETARRAGLTVWVVATGSEDRAVLEQARPDRLFADMNELAAALV